VHHEHARAERDGVGDAAPEAQHRRHLGVDGDAQPAMQVALGGGVRQQQRPDHRRDGEGGRNPGPEDAFRQRQFDRAQEPADRHRDQQQAKGAGDRVGELAAGASTACRRSRIGAAG
jgi:hypothetical protein